MNASATAARSMGADDPERGPYADPVGQRAQRERGYEDRTAPAYREPGRGGVGVAWGRGQGRRDPERVDAADAEPGDEEA